MEKVVDNAANMYENQENARSAYMDLDVASEMTVFTAKKILVEAGISMLAQSRTTQQAMVKLLQGGIY